MGTITQGILGGVRGKVGPVVGGKWKQTDYLRSYVIPKYTNTAPQVAQRSAMSAIVLFAKMMLVSIIQPLWNYKSSVMSGFNLFVKTNIPYFTSPNFLVTTSVKVATGNLLGVSNLASAYTTATGAVAVTWDDNSDEGNALETDFSYVVVANKNGTIYNAGLVTDPANNRGAGTLALSIPAGLTPADLICFFGFYRGTGSAFINSNSTGVICTA